MEYTDMSKKVYPFKCIQCHPESYIAQNNLITKPLKRICTRLLYMRSHYSNSFLLKQISISAINVFCCINES